MAAAKTRCSSFARVCRTPVGDRTYREVYLCKFPLEGVAERITEEMRRLI